MPRRDRLRRRSPVAKWSVRLLGVTGTAVVLAVGVVAGTMVMAADDDPAGAAQKATPLGEQDEERTAGGERRLTRRQREVRRRAMDEVRRRGYAPIRIGDYDADHVLRVLVGKPVGTAPRGRRAFFFVGDQYVGQDAATPSGKLRPGLRREREITLVYTLYEPGDRLCCPQGRDARVHFRWNGETLEPREDIPSPGERLPPG